jgi:RNA polymerase sigma-70 factor (ECF subfamily)
VPAESLYHEKELFLQIAAGDEKAFRELFDQYRERLFVFVWQLCHSVTDSEEVVQDIFLRLWENRAKLNQVDFPRKYMYVMARNRTLDLLTKIAKDQQMIKEVWANLSQSGNFTENLLQAAESQKLINEAVALLPEKKQTIFWLSRRDGLSHQEIAQQMGLSVQTVKNTLTEILKQIKSYLAEHSALLAILFWIETFSLLF